MMSGESMRERITLNLLPRAAEALASAVKITRESKTDCVNKALLLYGMLHEAQENGGAIYMKPDSSAELERLRVL